MMTSGKLCLSFFLFNIAFNYKPYISQQNNTKIHLHTYGSSNNNSKNFKQTTTSAIFRQHRRQTNINYYNNNNYINCNWNWVNLKQKKKQTKTVLFILLFLSLLLLLRAFSFKFNIFFREVTVMQIVKQILCTKTTTNKNKQAKKKHFQREIKKEMEIKVESSLWKKNKVAATA